MSSLQAGAGSAKIHFSQEMFPLEGFKGIHDDPHVRILVLKDDDDAAIVAMEQVMLGDDQVSEIQETVAQICGVKKDHVMVHLTHAITTPHNPMSMPPQARSENAEKQGKLHSEAIMAAVKSAAERAASSMKDATIGSADGFCAANCNRDEDTECGWWIGAGGQEIANQRMGIIKIAQSDGTPIAYIINYALKTCAVDNAGQDKNERLISSDVAGKACQMMEDKFHVPCLFLMSAAANHVPRETALTDHVLPDGTVETIDKGVEYGFRLVDSIGREMGEDAIAIAETVHNEAPQSGIKVRHETFPWQAMGRIDKKPVLEMEYPLENETKDIDVWTLTVGDFAFAGGKAEMNPPTQYAIIGGSSYPHTYFVSMINGGFKYMPETEAYDNYTWEAQSAFVAKGAAEKFAETAMSMLS